MIWMDGKCSNGNSQDEHVESQRKYSIHYLPSQLIEHQDLSACHPVVFRVVNQLIEVRQLSFSTMPKDIVLETVIPQLHKWVCISQIGKVINYVPLTIHMIPTQPISNLRSLKLTQPIH